MKRAGQRWAEMLDKMTEGQRFLLGMVIGGGIAMVGRWIYMGLIWGIGR
jgi:hypothetical protein